MATNVKINGVEFVLKDSRGQAFVDLQSPLSRVNYFDGKWMRAVHFTQEQNAFLRQVRLANRAGGGGIVHGFDCYRSGNRTLRIHPGLAFDWQGRALHSSGTVTLDAVDLVSRAAGHARKDPAVGLAGGSAVGTYDTTAGSREADTGENTGINNTGINNDVADLVNVYLLILSHREGFCGQDGVFANSSSGEATGNTYYQIVEGVYLSAWPLQLRVPLKQSRGVHLSSSRFLRSRLASALFAQEQNAVPDWISSLGLQGNGWCLGGEALTGDGIPLAVFAMNGNNVSFVDTWSVRRERVHHAPRLSRSTRFKHRSWRSFMAQVSQFQCQLRDSMLLATAKGPQPLYRYSGNQLILLGGFVELPSAGYLPVTVDDSQPVKAQLESYFGRGVDLRLCIAKQDDVAQAFVEAQHMERICLVSGLSDPEAKVKVDVLVPDGFDPTADLDLQRSAREFRFAFAAATTPLDDAEDTFDDFMGVPQLFANFHRAFRSFVSRLLGDDAEESVSLYDNEFIGRARTMRISNTGGEFNFAGSQRFARATTARGNGVEIDAHAWVHTRANQNPFTMAVGASTPIGAEFRYVLASEQQFPHAYQLFDGSFFGELQVTGTDGSGANEAQRMTALVSGELRVTIYQRNDDAPPRRKVPIFSTVFNLNETVYLELSADEDGNERFIARMERPSFFNRGGDSGGYRELVFTFTFGESSASSTGAMRAITNATAVFAPFDLAFSSRELNSEPDSQSAANDNARAAARVVQLVGPDPTFVDLTELKLFREPAAGRQRQVMEERIVARLDWVMFRRRRERTCAPIRVLDIEVPNVPTEPPVEPVTFRLIHAGSQATSGEWLADLNAGLEQGELEAEAFTLEDLGTVSFAEDASTLMTPAGDIVPAWQARQFAGDSIAYAALIQAEDTADQPDRINMLRVLNLLTALQDSTQVPADLTPGVFRNIRHGIELDGAEGFILLASHTLAVADSETDVRVYFYSYINFNTGNNRILDLTNAINNAQSPDSFVNELNAGNNIERTIRASFPVRFDNQPSMMVDPTADGVLARYQQVREEIREVQRGLSANLPPESSPIDVSATRITHAFRVFPNATTAAEATNAMNLLQDMLLESNDQVQSQTLFDRPAVIGDEIDAAMIFAVGFA